MADTPPTDFEGVLEHCGFSANARGVLTDPDQEGLEIDDLRTWENEDV